MKMKRKPKGIVTVLVPGGALEARNWSKNEIKLYLQKRKGFIKLAMRHGIDLVPTFSFNEQFIYRQLVSDTGMFSVSYNEPLHSSTRDENIPENVKLLKIISFCL